MHFTFHQPDASSYGDNLVIITLSEAKCFPVSEDPGPDSEVEESRHPEQVEVRVSGGVRE